MVEVATRSGEVEESGLPGLSLRPTSFDDEVVHVAHVSEECGHACVEHCACDNVHAVVDPQITNAVLVVVEVTTRNSDEVVSRLEANAGVSHVVLEVAVDKARYLYGEDIDPARSDGRGIVIL